MRNVPAGGNCLFHSVQMQLEVLGIQLDHRAMREQLVEYLEEHPYTHDGSVHLRSFFSDPTEDDVQRHADVEPAD